MHTFSTGTDPSVGNLGLTSVFASAGNLVFQHTLKPDPAADLSFVYEWSTDLVNWYGSGAANPGGTKVGFSAVNPFDPPYQNLYIVTATVTGTPPGKVFARIKVQQI